MTTTLRTPAITHLIHRAKYVTETVGTFVLVFTIGASSLGGSPLAPVAIGAALMAMIYAGGHISGAHYNPAVTLAVWVRGRITAREAVGYVASQIVGGVVAAAAVTGVMPTGPSHPLALSGHAMVVAAVAELVFTFVLCFVVLNVATSKDHPNNSFYGLAIGFTVAAGAVAVGAISGGVFNPAVGIAGLAIGMFTSPVVFVYLIVQLVAAVAAGMAFRFLNPSDK
ncbi:aquaporin Z [Mycolicibacterium sp. BK556]|uniref:aquaporin n=1 Tax=unclassified Mycolicibacterium TaxID=2636767 RepID=UPI0016115A60|nr:MULTISPECIES: aquaporin [unclassified Mycolicibacterium]MBB3600917.1 aquaporin Z [Mycolicibacterium sp. BK556]MBB3630671.1 aquaporin Z [Mycolicibacterium sp. BK607]MBB3748665.1 aquaporin Z [Mycolicibacterium sp. BK634]